MAKAGDRIENPVAGERIIFRQTAQETGGTLLQFDDLLRVGGFGPPEHVHPHQEERFHVVAGTMGLRVGDREQTLHPGESLTVPPGVPHTWWNAGTEELHQLAEFRPALNLETFFETLFGLARDGKCDQEGQPTFMQIAAMVPVYHIYLSTDLRKSY